MAKNLLILLVDDEPAILKIVGKRLELEGYEVATALNGEEALQKVESRPPNLIILDLMLPKIDGYSILLKLKQNPLYQEIPVVIYNGKGSLDGERRCHELGADRYIVKPGTDALVGEIKTLLKDYS